MPRLPSVLLAFALAFASLPGMAAPPLKDQLSQRTVLNLAAAERIAQAGADLLRP